MWRLTFLIRRNIFSQNGTRWALLLDLKEEWNLAFEAHAEVAVEKVNFFNKRFFKEEDEVFPGGDGVTMSEENIVLRVKSFSEEGG